VGHEPSATARARRLRRARRWLGVAIGAHVLIAAITVVVLRSAVLDSAPFSWILIGAAALPVLVMALVERRDPSRTRPMHWPLRSASMGVPQALAAGGAAALAVGTDPVVTSAVGVIALLAALGPAAMAGRALRSPFTADLGELDVEIIEKIRVFGHRRNRWSASDHAALTRSELQITLWPDVRTFRRLTFPLETIGEVTVRAATTHDNPWITLDTGQTYTVPAGTTVLAITHRHGSGVLPVYRPHAFAVLLDVRRNGATPQPV
jgi:hypothetical protein